MASIDAIEVRFIAGFGPIVRDAAPSAKLYADDLAIPFKEEAGGYLHTEALEGAKTCFVAVIAGCTVLLW